MLERDGILELRRGVRRHARNARRAWRLAMWAIALALLLPLGAELIGWMRRANGR